MTTQGVAGRRHQGGFTLPEMLIVLMVIALMVTIAVPNFTGLLARNALTARMNEMVGAMQAARSEAVTRNTRVSICRRDAAGTACSTSNSWAAGWLVFVDPNGDGVVDADETVLGNGNAVNDFKFFGELGDLKFFTFRPDGTTGAATSRVMSICKGKLYKGEVTIDVTGRPSAKRVNDLTGC